MTGSSSLAKHPYGDHPLPSTSNDGLLPQTAEATGHPIVGIDRPRKKLLRWLKPQEETTGKSLRVISIVGPAGMGKTTLALEIRKRLSYQTSGHHYFQCNVMAKVSRGTDRNELLLRDILSQICDPSPAPASSEAMALELLVHHVSERLQDMRYFILIDDMYMKTKSDWEKIKGAFPDNNLGSRILITTRFPSVAWLCCSDSGGLVHLMKHLNKIESTRLFLLKYCGSSLDFCVPENMKPYVHKIIMTCEGIPLFINGMADWLKQKLQQHQQEEVDEEQQMIRIFKDLQAPELPKQIQQALFSTFDDIPYELRLLSLYMCMFSYGYEFEKDRLIMKWLCEDLTDEWDGWRIVEDADAERFFSQLVDRNVIALVAGNYKSNQDETEACQWHVNQFMQQFLTSKSAETGFSFTSATTNLAGASATGHGNKNRILRRLALHHRQDPGLPSLFETIDISETRSLAVSGAVSRISLDKFNLVVLDLEGWENLKDEDILLVCRSKMFFLQYLSIRNTQVSKLPHEIKELCSLTILDLRGTLIRQLPKQIVELRSTLRALLLSGGGMINPIKPVISVPHDVQHLHRLSTLATIDLSEHPASFIDALGAMENLRVLAITLSFRQCSDGAYREALLSSIRKWKWLVSLTIHCGIGCSMEFLGVLFDPPQNLAKFKVTLGRFATVPKWISKLKFLSFVQITICRHDTDDLQVLGQLLHLQCLVLGLDFIPEEAIVIESVGFRELQRFSVDCPVPWLTFRTGAMPKLTCLQLKFCACPASSQTNVPSGIGNLQTLMEVALCYNVRYTNYPSIKVTVKAMREAVAEHDNQIDLFINGLQDYDVQAADEGIESAIGTHSGNGARIKELAKEIAVETARTKTEIQNEIELEEECTSNT